MTSLQSLVLCVGLLLCGGACSEVDVCERPWPKDFELNHDGTGEQAVGTPGALAALPNRGALLIFRSDAAYGLSQQHQVLKGVLLDERGAPLRTCVEDNEITYTPSETMGGVQNVLADLAPPETETGIGVFVYVRYDPNQPSIQVMGQQLRATGCTVDDSPSFQISDEPLGFLCDQCMDCEPDETYQRHCVGPPAVTRLDSGDFVAAWVSSHTQGRITQTELRARVLTPDFLGPKFQSTARVKDGGPATLGAIASPLGELAMVALPGGLFAIAWVENSIVAQVNVKLQLYNRMLQPTTDPIVIDDPRSDPPKDSSVRMAVHGNQLMVSWIALDEDNVSRVFARVVETQGEDRLVFPKENPLAFRVSNTDCGDEAEVAITPLQAERAAFMVAWRAGECDASSTSIRAALLDEAGLPVFSNRACNVRDFKLVTTDGGGQAQIALAATAAGSVALAWTDRGLNGGGENDGSDRSVSAVRGTVIPLSALLPEP
jgi:hypothetical protein